MEKHFFEVVVVVELKAIHVVVEEVANIVDVDEEVVQPVDVVEEVVQELIDLTKESYVVLYLSFHVHDAARWNCYSPYAFHNQDLSYQRVIFDC